MMDSFVDDAVWHVRQSVLFAVPAVLSRLPAALKRTQALKIVNKLASDPSVGVRTGLLEVIGELIYSFHDDEGGPPKELLSLFLGDDPPLSKEEPFGHSPGPPGDTIAKLPAIHMQVDAGAQSPLNATSNDPARALICAFNFPAVVLTLGPSRWGELRGVYLQFVQMESPKILQTLAASIGEIAKIVGPGNAHADLVHAWLRFARFKDSVVRLKSLEALESFLGALNPQDRTTIASSLEDLWTNHLRSWKKRELLARMLSTIASSFLQAPHSLKRLLRFALRDGYATVRSAGVESVRNAVLNLMYVR
jgi:serine/threonine-protein phosphatase 4 regulatory subunit 1